MYWLSFLKIQGVYDFYFLFNSSNPPLIGSNTKKACKIWVLITFYIIKIIALALSISIRLTYYCLCLHIIVWGIFIKTNTCGVNMSPVNSDVKACEMVLTNLPLPFILWHEASAFFISHQAHKQLCFYGHTLQDAFSGSCWPRDQGPVLVNWETLLLFPSFQNIYCSELRTRLPEPTGVLQEEIWRSTQELTADFCFLAHTHKKNPQNTRTSARYTSTLMKPPCHISSHLGIFSGH